MADEAATADMQLAREIPDYVYLFVESALPDDLVGKLELKFRTLTSPRSNAYVHAEGRNLYRITLSHGLIDALYHSLFAYFERYPGDPMISPEELALLGAEEPEKALSIVYLFALSFASFHEMAHVLSGHMEFWQSEYGRGFFGFAQRTYSETRGVGAAKVKRWRLFRRQTPEAVPLSVSEKLIELEADSMATTYLTELVADIAGMLFEGDFLEHVRKNEQAYPVLDTLMLTGVALTTILLEIEREHDPQGRETYPLPATRLLIICKSVLDWIILDSKAPAGQRSLRPRVGLSSPEPLAFYFGKVCLPALAFARRIALSMGGEAALERMGLMEITVDGGFLSDLQKLSGDALPSNTNAGLEHAELKKYITQFGRRIYPFRKTDWWRAP